MLTNRINQKLRNRWTQIVLVLMAIGVYAAIIPYLFA